MHSGITRKPSSSARSAPYNRITRLGGRRVRGNPNDEASPAERRAASIDVTRASISRKSRGRPAPTPSRSARRRALQRDPIGNRAQPRLRHAQRHRAALRMPATAQAPWQDRPPPGRRTRTPRATAAAGPPRSRPAVAAARCELRRGPRPAPAPRGPVPLRLARLNTKASTRTGEDVQILAPRGLPPQFGGS